MGIPYSMNELIVEGFDEEDFVDLKHVLAHYTQIPVGIKGIEGTRELVKVIRLMHKVDKILDALKSQDEEV